MNKYNISEYRYIWLGIPWPIMPLLKPWPYGLGKCQEAVSADVGWMKKTCIDLRSNLISTKVSASHRKSMQEQARLGQTEAQVYFDNVMTKFIVNNRTDA